MSAIWGSGCPLYQINDLQIIQNKAIRTIFHKDYYINKINTQDIMTMYAIPNIHQLIQLDSTMFFYKIQNNLIKNNYVMISNADIHSYNTRTRANIHLTKSTTNYGIFNIYSNGAKLFNALDTHLKSAPSIQQFKKKTKKTHHSSTHSCLTPAYLNYFMT